VAERLSGDATQRWAFDAAVPEWCRLARSSSVPEEKGGGNDLGVAIMKILTCACV
jgi:hypothetical protein